MQVSVQGQPHDAKNDGTHELNRFEKVNFDVGNNPKILFLTSFIRLHFEFLFELKIDVFENLKFGKIGRINFDSLALKLLKDKHSN